MEPVQQLLSMASEHRAAMLWISCGSAVMFVGSLLLVPWLVARAPRDFFVREHVPRRGAGALALRVMRNLLGVLLLVAGLLMLVLPGQGLLVVLLAVSLLDLPGKRALLQRIVRRPPVWRALTFLRQRADEPPFEQP